MLPRTKGVWPKPRPPNASRPGTRAFRHSCSRSNEGERDARGAGRKNQSPSRAAFLRRPRGQRGAAEVRINAEIPPVKRRVRSFREKGRRGFEKPAQRIHAERKKSAQQDQGV